MREIPINLNVDEIIIFLEYLSFDGFEKNKELIQKIINQLNVPLQAKPLFWDRIQYFMEKLTKQK